MKTHKLLLYEFASRRFRNKLLLLWLSLLGVALYDTFITPILGDYWFLMWIAVGALLLLWVYYAFLLRRGAIIVTPNFLVLQGPLNQVKISYGRVTSVTSSHLSQHYELRNLKGRERFMVEPLYQYTCGFVELYSYPKKLSTKKRKRFPKFLFSPRRLGLLLVVDDWMKLSRDVEIARQKWRETHKGGEKEDTRTLAARILDY